MLPLTQTTPKCLLPFRNTTILEYQLNMLRENGVCEIIIVNGFAAEQIEKVAGRDIVYIYNRHYLTTNSLYSLFLARHHLDADILLLNSDVLYDGEIVKVLIEEESPNAIAVDFKKPLVNGEMNVRISNGYVIEISKTIPMRYADGRSAQLAKFRKKSVEELRNEVTRLVYNSQLNSFPTDAYGPIIKGNGLRVVDVQDRAWLELDTPEDYEYLCNEFYEKIIGRLS